MVCANAVLSFSYAQESCSMCNGSHSTLEQYRSFVLDVLNEVETYASYGQDAWSNGTPWLFQDGWLVVNQSNALDKGLTQLAKNINQWIQTSFALVGILGNTLWSWVVGDLLPGFWLTRSNETLQRDMDMLLELDELITEKKLQLWLWWWLYSNIDIEHVKKFQNIKNQYQWILLYDGQGGWLKVGTTETYNDLLKLLGKTQQDMKWFLSFGWTSAFIKPNGTPRTTSNKNGWIKFQPQAIVEMKEAYTCVRWLINQCDSNMQSFGKVIGEKADEGYNDIKKSLSRFADSAKKLWAVFRKEEITLPNIEELQAICDKWDEKSLAACQALQALGEWWTSRNWLLFNSTQKRVRWNVSGLKELWIGTITKWADDANKEMENDTKKAGTENQFNKPWERITLGQDLENMLQDSMSETISSYSQIQQHAIFSNARDITQQIPILCASIQNTLDTIGDKEARQTIIQNLGIACEKQCSNVWGICRY